MIAGSRRVPRTVASTNQPLARGWFGAGKTFNSFAIDIVDLPSYRFFDRERRGFFSRERRGGT
jgi:hypothetical protein